MARRIGGIAAGFNFNQTEKPRFSAHRRAKPKEGAKVKTI
jgi:hypothetical protein